MDSNNARRYDTPGTSNVNTNTPTDEAHKRGLITGLVVGIIGGGIVGGIIGAMLDDGRTATPQQQIGTTPDRNRIYGTPDANQQPPRTTDPNTTTPRP